MPRILLIDDAPEIQEANVSHLTGQGFEVTAADTGIKAMACLSEQQFDCIVLDVMLPDIDGYAICKAARTVTDAPIIFLSCMDDLDDKLKGLTAGGDDYLTKPYSLKELTARIRAMLRRQRDDTPNIAHSAEFYIDEAHRMLRTPEKNVFLSQKEFDLFLLIHENPDNVFSKEELFKRFWPGNADMGAVAVYIKRLRQKLDFAKSYIGTIESDYGMGYHMKRRSDKGAETGRGED
jgi:DNA-binding response OmpR family regulator